MRNTIAFYKSFPKVELHRHLEGSLRLQTMLDIARTQGINVPCTTKELSRLVQVQKTEANTFQNFLSKFVTLRMFYCSGEVIQRITREAVQDAADDNVRYLELRFTPVALSRAKGFPMGEVMDWVCESASQAAQECGIRVGLIASVNRHESVDLAAQVVQLAAARLQQGILGLDLAGNEAEFPALPFKDIFKEARQAGLKLTVHAGEWAGAANVREALEILEASRIGHGVRVLEDPGTVALACERGTAFEVCITSNFQTGSVPSIQDHPMMKMLDAGLNITIGTDDPSISKITLSNEYRLVVDTLGMENEQLQERLLAAARASFLPRSERDKLIKQLFEELST